MPPRLRKLIGALGLLLFVTAYALIVMALSHSRLAEAHGLAELAFYLVAGLAWVVPAGVIIGWMQRP